jgi:uncharacterized protein YhdP
MSHRWKIALVAVAAVVVVLALGFQVAVRELRAGVEHALGPRASVGAVQAKWNGIHLRDVRVRGGRPWPADDELRAAHVHVVPDLASLWSSGWRVRRVTVEGGYVSLLRTRDGRLRVLPSLLDDGNSNGPAPTVRIGEVALEGATVELFDASVRQPPHRLRIERLDARVGPLALPALDEAMAVDLRGVFKGARRDGTLAVDGEVTPASRDAKIQARLAGVDLVALQPYLLRAGEGGVRRGSLDLVLSATVRRNRLHAPGQVTLSGLEFAGGGGTFGTFAGVPRQAVVAALSGGDGRVHVAFTLEGRLDDPAFSLNGNLAVRVAAGLAQTLGVSVGGVVQGVGNVIKGLLGR